MNIRARAEREIGKNLDSMNLQDVFLVSPGSRAETNMILAQILNRQHHLNTPRKASACCPILRMSVAA